MNETEEYRNITSKLPDLEGELFRRINLKKSSTSPIPTQAKFDPYQALLKKKEEETVPIDPSTIKQWSEKDLKTLQDYCEKMGIIGFSCGKMHPIAALAMLKQQFGENFEGVPLEERVPAGYQKIGTTVNNPSYPFSKPLDKRQVLHG
jgi:hypothetical protein